jgi:type II secretory pathway component GspD/PulD (secretin)
MMAGVAGIRCQAPLKPAHFQSALNSGIDCYRQADYEAAEKFFQQAQEGQDELSPAEREELGTLIRRTGDALKAQREGSEQLRKAENAAQSGNNAEAAAILKTISTNQFLTAADKAKVQQLTEKLQAGDGSQNPEKYIHPLLLARNKLQQARQLMAKANYDAAEALAREADKLKVNFRPGEDTPRMVLDDIARLRTDPKKLLLSARVAYQKGDLDRAETLARAADKAASPFTFSQLWGDSPAKVLKDVQAARARQAASAQSKKVAQAAKTAPMDSSQAAHELLKHGRTALNRGDLEQAKQCATQAVALKGNFHWWEDNPSKLVADVQHAMDKDKRYAAKEKTMVVSAKAPDGEDPQTLLKNGRDMLNAEKYEEAEKLALQAQAAGKTNWGLFDDSPEKLLQDIRRTVVKHDQEESVRLLADARVLFDKGDFDAAKVLAHRAERLHGPYGNWELGDRPAKLLSEIDAAVAKQRGTGPAPTPVEVARQDGGRVPPPEGFVNPQVTPKIIQTRTEVRPDAPPVNSPDAELWTRHSEGSGDPTSAVNSTDAEPRTQPSGVSGNPTGAMAQAADSAAAKVEPAKMHVVAMLAEARQMQKANRLVEARQKALEAQKVGLTFAPEEDSPERALLQLADLASKRIEQLVQEASDFTATGFLDAGRFEKAEQDLTQARELAVGFALDTQAIEAKMNWVQRTRNQMAAAPAPAAQQEPQVAPRADKTDAVAPVAVEPPPAPTTPPAAPNPAPLPVATSPAPAPTPVPAPLEPARSPSPMAVEQPPVPTTAPTPPNLAPLPVPMAASPASAPTPVPAPLEPARSPSPMAVEQPPVPTTAPAAPNLAALPVPMATSPAPAPTPVPAPLEPARSPSPMAVEQPPVPTLAPEGQLRLRTPANMSPVAPAQHQETPPAAVPSTMPSGQEMLDKARLEIQRGELETARRLAVEVYNGPYGLQAQADAVLHSIDAAEFNQKIAAANKSLDAGLNAVLRRDFVQAGSILRSIDAHLLPPDKQARLKEMLQLPELQVNGTPDRVPGSPGTDAHTSVAGDSSDNAGQEQRSSPETSYQKQVQAMQEVQFKKLRVDGLEAQKKATDLFRNGDTAQALEVLEGFLNAVAEAQLEPEKAVLLQRPVESRLQGFKKLKAQQDFEKARAAQPSNSFNPQREAEMEEHKKEQVAELMKKYHALYHDGKYKEAEMAAAQAHELDPDNVAAAAAIEVAHMHRNLTEYENIKKGKEDMVLHGLNDAENEGPFVTHTDPLKLDQGTWDKAKNRKVFPNKGWEIKIRTEKEIEIDRRLTLPISVDFRDTPLKDVIDELRGLTGINIVPDMPALYAENISLDQPVKLHLEGVMTKTALELLLHQAHLIYVVKDEVILVTTEAFNRGKQVARTYQVADLIIPVDNSTLATSDSFNKTMELVNSRNGMSFPGATPFLPGHSLPNGSPVGSQGVNPSANPTSSAGTSDGSRDNGRAPGQTMEDLLIKMITNTIKPESWSNMGGSGTIEYYPLGMALVINQTPDIQEQVQELLTALRRLQDVEVAIEVRFITISEAFYERIGIDFNLNIQTNNTKNSAQIVAQQFQPAGFNNVFTPKDFLVGLLPGGQGGQGNNAPGAYTADLNIPVQSSSFGPAVPPFGGFPGGVGNDGGLSLGLAFLSDIQVFLFMEAAQGDRRTNVMQAPKLTLFNGQSSTITVGTQQFFVTNISAFQVNGQVVWVPSNQAFPLNLSLAIQAVISADRRFVRLNLNPSLTNLTTPVTALFPITTFITPVFDNGAQGQPVPFTAYVQQPNFAHVEVNTAVSIPDGGTVLLGGLKTLREGRNEFGPPILSKLPYVNRLFKNVGYGREAESLLIMVTPRIIINEEEEYKLTDIGQISATAGGAPAAAPAGAAPVPTAK